MTTNAKLRTAGALFLVVSAFAATDTALAQTCPNPPVPTITSSQVPSDVCIPQGFGGNPITFFDDYSWRTFIAMVWPVANGQRGHPDTSKTVAAAGPRVFETFKSIWEVFHNDGSAPGDWNTYDPPQFNACGASVAFGDVVIASFSKFSDIGQAGNGTLVGPLVAQNRTYVRYMTGFDEIEFNQIKSGSLYLRSKLPMTGPFNNGAVDVKSAWIDMRNVQHPERYYTRPALVLDLETGKCSSITVGLVGLHIVQKTPTRPQWIWSSFEQVDNVPPPVSGGPGTFNFNDGTGAKMPDTNPFPLDPPILPPPAPFNVERVASAPINPSTVTTNGTYQQLLKNAGSVWQFYQLVMTQWPVPASRPDLPGTPANTFPGINAQSAFANVTMETFDQGSITTGCMNCHNFTRLKTDFLWSLNDHAFPPNVPNFLFEDTSFRDLRNLLRLNAPATRLTPASPAR
jgi:hypothetical protein